MPSTAAAGAAGRGLGAGHAPARGLEVVAAHYSNGVLLLAEAAAGESRTRLFMLSRYARLGVKCGRTTGGGSSSGAPAVRVRRCC